MMVKLGPNDIEAPFCDGEQVATGSDEHRDDDVNDAMKLGECAGGGGVIGGVENGVSPPFTMPGVMHYIAHEWRRFEMERADWDMERADLQARISYLQGERKGQENLKVDLVRRIQMLEFALEEERSGKHRPIHDGSEPSATNVQSVLNHPIAVDADAATSNSNCGWKNGRQLLRQYLEEIGQSENMLNLRTCRVRSLLGLPKETEGPITGKEAKMSRRASMAPEGLNENEKAVLSTFEFLSDTTSASIDDGASAEGTHVDEQNEPDDEITVIMTKVEADEEEEVTVTDGRYDLGAESLV